MPEPGPSEGTINTEKVDQQRRTENTLEMDLENAGILHFAPLGGLNIRNERQYARRDWLTIPYPAREINEANNAEKEYHEKRGKGVDPLSEHFEYKVTLLNARREGNTFVYDTKPTTFVMFNDERVGISKPENVKLRSEFGTPLASALIVFTTEPDGSRKMIVQNRSLENAVYKKMLGASIAGTNEHTINRTTGALNHLGEAELRRFILDEMGEEIGIIPDFIEGGADKGIQVVGVGIDKRLVHYEMLLTATVKMSAEELAKRAQENLSVKRKPFDFAEKVLVLPGTPEAIRQIVLLKTPIPPTHTAAFIAAGRMLVLERDGEEAANEWIKTLEVEVKANIKDIDRIVREATNGQEQGYNPRKAPEEQGLQTAEEALKETGLLETK